ncbi:MAG: cupredoxin domain-containing protein [Actinomycetota bacterium]|nr:cupredoxin domain-containing protein [Actinomycetota bacterium]
MRRAAALVAALALLALAAPAAADERVYAVPVNQYSSTVITIDQGEALFFRNIDLQQHDLVSKDQAGGKPIFGTPLLGPGEEALVQGVQQLKGGSYPFFCTVHPFMTGTLNVTGAGAPSPPPQQSGDTTAPKVSVKVLDSSVSKVRKNRKLRVDVTVDEAGNGQLTATMRQGKKTVTIAKGARGFARAGKATVSMALTKAGQSALRNKKSAAVTVQAHVTDGAGNTGHGTGKRTLKR